MVVLEKKICYTWVMEELIENLKAIGFNGYEAKVYLALLKKYPATGYEVAKHADIPQARAYDTLKALEIAHIVTSTNTKPISYTPINPKELTKRFRRQYSSTLDFLEKKLPNVKDDHIEPVLHVSGGYLIHTKITEIIKSAKREIFIEIWSHDFKYYEDELRKAYNRGVDVKIVGYDNFTCTFGSLFHHSNGREIEHSIGSRMIFIAVDNSEGIFGKIGSHKNQEPNLLWTKNLDLVFLIKEFIVHDMCLIDISEKFPEQLKYFYGTGLRKLKDKILSGSEFYKVY